MRSQKNSTVTAFKDWVFCKTIPNFENKSASKENKNDHVEKGQYAHEYIEQFYLWLSRARDAPAHSTDWGLIYADPHDGSLVESFKASRLLYQGQPLRGKPDVVLRNRESDAIIIIERKCTFHSVWDLPSDAWPNVRAQLWCYGWIDDWFESPQITLVCQYWKFRPDVDHRSKIDQNHPFKIHENPKPWWNWSDPNLQQECRQLFEEYGGRIVE